MKQRSKITIGVAAVVAAASIPVAAMATSSEAGEVDVAITGSAFDAATTAALAHLGEGRVTETEVGDEESLYEVEVALPGGGSVDVQLDENFEIVGTEADHARDDG